MGQFPAWLHNYFPAVVLSSSRSQVLSHGNSFTILKFIRGSREGMLNFVTDTDLATFTIKLGRLKPVPGILPEHKVMNETDMTKSCISSHLRSIEDTMPVNMSADEYIMHHKSIIDTQKKKIYYNRRLWRASFF